MYMCPYLWNAMLRRPLMADMWKVGPNPTPTATVSAKMRSTVSSPKGASPLPVPALSAALGHWSGSPRTRTAGW